MLFWETSTDEADSRCLRVCLDDIFLFRSKDSHGARCVQAKLDRRPLLVQYARPKGKVLPHIQ